MRRTNTFVIAPDHDDEESDASVTSCIVRTKDGENYTEYRVGGVFSPSSEALESALDPRYLPQTYD
jgi:hypothetical protein